MFSAIYWFQPNPGPLTPNAWLFYALCAAVFVAGVVWSGWRLSRAGARLWPRFELVVGLTGLALIGARLAQMPGWSARIWPLLLVGLALSGPLAATWTRRPRSPLDELLRLAAFRPPTASLPLAWQLTLWGLHLLGLAAWARAAGLPPVWVILLWTLLLLGQVLAARVTNPQAVLSRVSPDPAPLTPLFLAYASGGLYLLFDLSHYPMPIHPVLAELYWLPFYLTSMTAAAIIYAGLVEIFWLIWTSPTPKEIILAEEKIKKPWRSLLDTCRVGASARPLRLISSRKPVYILSGILAVSSLFWLAFELFTHRTHGVTGTDPYGYAQVAVDWVTQGTVLHRFDLFPRIASLNIPWAPVIAQGYHLPLNGAGDAASVWPLGMYILLAAGYWLWGETGLYLVGPLLALLTAPLVGRLAVEISRSRFKRDLPAAGCVSLFIWATSIEVIDRSLAPMADVAAALFTALVWIALLKLRANVNRPQGFNKPLRSYLWALAAGLALGLAFAMRYTQLLLVVSVIIGIVTLMGVRGRQKAGLLAAAGIGALAAALPDIIYRWQVFGSLLAVPQERELTHFAWANFMPTAANMAQLLLHGQEFGLLVPFLAAGLIWHWRLDRAGLVTLAAGALAVTALQLPYQALRLRDLLPLFPLLAAWSGLGLVWVWRKLVNLELAVIPPRLVHLLIASAFFLTLLLPAARVEPLLTRAWRPHRASFGYVSANERTALAQLQRLTPASAAIGLQMNGGAIALHSRRQPFYPGGWSQVEFDRFLTRMAEDNVPVFLLDDGPAVGAVIERLTATGRLRLAARLDVPLPEDYPDGGQLYEVWPEQFQ